MGLFSRKKKTLPTIVSAVDDVVVKPSSSLTICRARFDVVAGHKVTPGLGPSDGNRIIRQDFEVLGDDPIVAARPDLFDMVGWVQDGERVYIEGWEPSEGAPLTHEDN